MLLQESIVNKYTHYFVCQNKIFKKSKAANNVEEWSKIEFIVIPRTSSQVWNKGGEINIAYYSM